jgi:hexosaminidase
VIGAQINAWTEHMRTLERVEHAAFPRMAAFAETAWSPPMAPSAAPAPKASADTVGRSAPAPFHRSWDSFLHRLPAQFARYKTLGIHYADSAFAVKLSGTSTIELSNQVNAGEIRYTLNGGEPTRTSSLYTAPVPVKPPSTVKAATFLDGVQMSAPRSRTFSRASALRRTDTELRSCSNKLVLRLEDDAPATGPRAVFSVDILDPCWIWEKADLSRITGIAASVGQLPFNFQVGDAVKQIPLYSPRTLSGELEVHRDTCEGERIAVLPLAPAASDQAVTSLPRVSLSRAAEGATAGVHDLCLRFTRRGVDPIWALQSVQLFE